MSKSLSHQVGVLALGRVFAYAVMFFVPIVNTHSLSVEHYGYYKQFWLLFETLTPILILGFPRSLLYYLPRAESDKEKSVYATQTVMFLFATSMLAVVFYVVMGQILGAGLGAMIRNFFWRLCFFTVCMMLSDYMDWLFAAERQVRRQAIYHAVSSATLAISVMTVSWYTRSVNALIWTVGIFSGVKCAFALGYTTLVYKPTLRRVSLTSMREQLSFALPLGMMAIALLLLAQTDKFIINRLLGREAYAVYIVGAFQLPFVNIIASSVASVTLPMMARYQKDGLVDEVGDLWKRATLKLSLLFSPVFVFFIIAAKKLFAILYPEAYAGAVPVFQIYLFIFLKSVVDMGSIMAVFKQQLYFTKILVFAIVTNIILSLVLFDHYGRLGVPVSSVITYFVVVMIVVKKASRLLNRPFFHVLPWAGMVIRFGTACAPGIVLYLLYRRVAGNSIWAFVLAAVAYFVAYFSICLMLRLVGWREFKSLLSGSQQT